MSITAAGEATSPRTLHRVGTALVLAVCTSLFVVAGTNAQPASAKIDTMYLERMLKTVPKSAAGGATVVGGTLTGAGLAGSAAAAVAGYFVFDASYDATTAVLNWAFAEESQDVDWMAGPALETATVGEPSGTTSAMGGCWLGSNTASCSTYQGNSTYDAWFKDAWTHSTSRYTVLQSYERVSANGQTFKVRMDTTDGHLINVGPSSYRAWVKEWCNYGSTMQQMVFPTTAAAVNTVTFTVTRSCPVGQDSHFDLYFGDSEVGAWGHRMYQPWATPTPLSAPAPSHKWRTVVTCPGGQTVTAVSAATFTEQDATIPSIVPPACPDGARPTGLEVYEGDATGAGGTKRVDWQAPAVHPYVECLPGGAQSPCTMELHKITPQGYVECTGDNIDCTGYDPQTSTDAQYLCTWGTYTLPLSDCSPLVALQEVPGPDPQAPAEPIPGTIGQGTPVHNPDGSVTVTQTQTMPDGSTRTVTTTTWPDGSKTVVTQPLDPNGQPTGSPSVVNIPAPGSGTQTDPDGQNCMDGAFTWNPLSWVYTPVKCALQWAFVPPPGSLEAAFGGVGDAWNNTAVGTFGGMVGDVFGPIGDLATMEPDGCMGPLVTIPLPVGPDLSLHPLNVCSPLAQMVLGWWMPAAAAGIYLATFFGIYHGFGRALGLSTPVVRAKA